MPLFLFYLWRLGMSNKIAQQEEIVAKAFSEVERLGKAAEARWEEWSALRSLEQKAYNAWRVEHKLLSKMKENNYE